MAETDLKITVTVPGIKTLDDARRALKELNKELGATAIDNIPKQKALGAEIVKVKNIISDATASTQTANAKMMKSYFQTGEELRRFYREQRLGDRTMREATATIGGFGSMLGGEGIGRIVGLATQRFQEMEFAVNGLGIAAQGGSAKIASLGQKLIGFAGPLAIAAAGFGLLKMAIDETAAITERFNQALERNTQLLIKVGAISKEQQMRMLSGQIAKAAGEKVSPNWFLGLLPGSIGMKAMGEDLMTKTLDKQTELTKLFYERLQIERDLIIAQEQLWEPTKEELEEEKRLRQDVLDIQKQQVQWQIQGERAIAEGFAKRGIAGKIGTDVGLKGLPRVAGVGSIEFMSEQISAAQMAVNTLSDSMSKGFQEATSYLAEGFAQAFGLGNSLLDRMISTFATSALMSLPSMIASMLTAGATGNIFTALGALIFDDGGRISEPVIGMGLRSKRPYGIALNGQPEYITPMSQMSQAGRYGAAQAFSLRTEISGSNLAIIVESGTRQNNQRRLS